MGKQKSKKNKVKTNSVDYAKINKIFFILYSILITLPLLFRGGYFEKELLPILIALNMVFIIWLFIHKDEKGFQIFTSPIEVLFLGIVVLYLLSFFYGVNKRESILEIVKYFSYLAIIIMARSLSSDKKIGKNILDVILLGGVLVSLIGIGSAIGIWDYNGAVVGNRLSSTFQYPNTLAAYVGGIYFIALTLAINEDKGILKGIYGAVAGTLIFSLILTYSRAMWVIFPISIALYFVLIPNSRKLESVLYIIVTGIISIIASFLFTKGMADPSSILWVYYLLASIGSGSLFYLVSLFDNKFRKVSTRKLLLALSIIFILVIISGIYLINVTTEITLENITDKDTWTTLVRNVSNSEPLTEYELSLDYTGENTVNAPHLGRVIIADVNNNGDVMQLVVEDIVDSTTKRIIIPFTTGEDSVGIRVSFQNYYSKTSITINQSILTDSSTNHIIKDIPLKYKYIPEGIISRFSSINAGESSFTARLAFFKDGLRIIKDYPILGTGGGGWKTLYQSYQSYFYTATLAHNYFLQLWIEIGIIGLVFILGLLLLLTLFSFKTYKTIIDTNTRVLIVGCFVTVFTMLFHAFVDFDMSMSAYAIVVWVVLGLLISLLKFEGPGIKNTFEKIKFLKSKGVIYILITLSLVLTITMSSLIFADIYGEKAVEASGNDKIGIVMSNLEKAIKLDKYEPIFKINLANTYMSLYSMTEDVDYARKAIELMDEYIKISKFSSIANINAGNFYISIGELKEGLEHLNKAIEMQPLMSENYTQKADGYLTVFDYYYSQREDRLAKKTLEEGLNIKEQISEVNLISQKPLKENEDLVYKLGKLKYLYENMDSLQDLSDRNLVLDFAYYFDIDVNSDGEIDMLYSSIPEGSKLDHKILTEREENFIKITNEGEVLGYSYIYPLNFEPNTYYIVEMKARGNTQPDIFKVYVWSTSSKEPNQGGLESIRLKEDWDTYSFEFATDSDVEPGKPYIILQHSGKDEGYIDIKELTIFKED